jgi:hypothetical protein
MSSRSEYVLVRKERDIMKAKQRTASGASIEQAELILKLYELRRESVMREARSYVGGEFLPASADKFVQIVSAGGR